MENEIKEQAINSISYFWKEKGHIDYANSEKDLEMFPEIKFAYQQLKMITKSIDKMVEDL